MFKIFLTLLEICLGSDIDELFDGEHLLAFRQALEIFNQENKPQSPSVKSSTLELEDLIGCPGVKKLSEVFSNPPTPIGDYLRINSNFERSENSRRTLTYKNKGDNRTNNEQNENYEFKTEESKEIITSKKTEDLNLQTQLYEPNQMTEEVSNLNPIITMNSEQKNPLLIPYDIKNQSLNQENNEKEIPEEAEKSIFTNLNSQSITAVSQYIALNPLSSDSSPIFTRDRSKSGSSIVTNNVLSNPIIIPDNKIPNEEVSKSLEDCSYNIIQKNSPEFSSQLSREHQFYNKNLTEIIDEDVFLKASNSTLYLSDENRHNFYISEGEESFYNSSTQENINSAENTTLQFLSDPSQAQSISNCYIENNYSFSQHNLNDDFSKFESEKSEKNFEKQGSLERNQTDLKIIEGLNVLKNDLVGIIQNEAADDSSESKQSEESTHEMKTKQLSDLEELNYLPETFEAFFSSKHVDLQASLCNSLCNGDQDEIYVPHQDVKEYPTISNPQDMNPFEIFFSHTNNQEIENISPESTPEDVEKENVFTKFFKLGESNGSNKAEKSLLGSNFQEKMMASSEIDEVENKKTSVLIAGTDSDLQNTVVAISESESVKQKENKEISTDSEESKLKEVLGVAGKISVEEHVPESNETETVVSKGKEKKKRKKRALLACFGSRVDE